MDDESVPDEPADIEVLRSACRESRAVLDDQLEEVSNIGDTALWTIRTSMIALGVVVSAASLAGVSSADSLHWATLTAGLSGVAALLASSLYGLGLYVSMERIRGIGASYRERMTDTGVDERAWRRELLDGYGEWTTKMEHRTDTYGSQLFVVQMGFYGGVFLFALAGCLSLWTA